jgi:hypothetical protein
MINPTLLTESRRLLDQARMIAEAPASQAGQIGHGHPSSKEPPGLLFTTSSVTHIPSTLESFGQAINLAIAHDSDSELRAANEWCASELQSLQHGSVVVAETEKEFDERIVRDYPGVPAPQVARAERTYVRRVRDARLRLGTAARDGLKIAGSVKG